MPPSLSEAPPQGRPLAGRHAVVTGGSRGIGAAIAAELAGLGADLTLMGRNSEALGQQREILIATHGGQVFHYQVDVGQADQVAQRFEWAANTLGPVAILVNNAGISPSAPFHRVDEALWHEVMETNLSGPFRCTQAVLPAMLEAGWGRVVNIASTAGKIGYRYVTAYCAAKHGLIGLTRSLALEVAQKGVTVNAVCPGFTATAIVSESVAEIVAKTGRTDAEALAEITKYNPQGRLIEPIEVAQAVAWLCLPSSGAVTGQSIMVDGGEAMP
ncbi:MAG: 3-oxoacyl-ACP reductase FabG [Alphaproteobacteria bacterium]|nr:3-oxoacyl-ACP reductase FabG [Alphaproteobacteria bacterium]